MGIIRAGISAIRGAAADQWKEAFCAPEMGSEVLIARTRKLSGQNSSNNGSGEVITHGSLIIVGEGECAIATEGGKVIGVYDQPGEQTFQSGQSGGVFGGGFGAFAKDVGRRISFGGDITISQKLYYINTKELTGGRIRAEGIPLRFKDQNAGIDIDGGVSCFGSYTFRIVNPELFYKAAMRSIDGRSRRELLKQMDSEVLTALSPALAKLTADGIRPGELPQHTEELCEKLRQIMSSQWSGLRGIAVSSVALESVTVLDAEMIRSLQRNKAFQNPLMVAAHLTGAKADAMQSAAANRGSVPGGAIGVFRNLPGVSGEWRCKCGTDNKGKIFLKKPDHPMRTVRR